MVTSGYYHEASRSSGKIVGREKFLEGIIEFCTNARVLEYTESDEQIDIIANCAIASVRFDMLYERSAYREHSQGRDFWIFNKVSGHWLAIWRTIYDVVEVRKQKD